MSGPHSFSSSVFYFVYFIIQICSLYTAYRKGWTLRWDSRARFKWNSKGRKTCNIHENYFHNTSFSGSLLWKINMNFFNTGLIFTREVFILGKKVWGSRRSEAVNFDIPSLLQLFIKEKELLHNLFFSAWFYFKIKWDDEICYANDVNKNFL